MALTAWPHNRCWQAWLLAVLCSATVSVRADDPRLRIMDAPRPWERAVLRMETPVRQRVDGVWEHRTERCTASVIRGGQAPLLLTAWHCVEGRYDLTKPPRLRIAGRWYPLRVVAEGGSMAADWAVVEAAVPLPVTVLPLHTDPLIPGTRVTLGGYSGDSGLGAGGKHLTYHEGCHITVQQAGSAESDCLAYRGASGGPVLTRRDDGRYELAGVISAGDSRTRSVLIPISHFHRRLLALL